MVPNGATLSLQVVQKWRCHTEEVFPRRQPACNFAPIVDNNFYRPRVSARACAHAQHKKPFCSMHFIEVCKTTLFCAQPTNENEKRLRAQPVQNTSFTGIHKGERVTHVEQRVNYIMININVSDACAFQHIYAALGSLSAAKVRTVRASTHAHPPLGCIRNLGAALPFTYFDAYCNIRGVREVQRESERQIHNNNNNIICCSFEERLMTERRSAPSACGASSLYVMCVCMYIYATGKLQ